MNENINKNINNNNNNNNNKMNKFNKKITTAKKLPSTAKSKDDQPAPTSRVGAQSLGKNGVSSKTPTKSAKSGDMAAPKSKLFGFSRRDSQTFQNTSSKIDNSRPIVSKNEKQNSENIKSTVERKTSTLPSMKTSTRPSISRIGSTVNNNNNTKQRGLLKKQTKDPAVRQPQKPTRSFSMTPISLSSSSVSKFGNGHNNTNTKNNEDVSVGKSTTVDRSGLPLRRSTSLKYPSQPLTDQTNRPVNVSGNRTNLRKQSLITIHQEKETSKIFELETKFQLFFDGLTVVIQHLVSQLEHSTETLNEKLDNLNTIRSELNNLETVNSRMLIEHNEKFSTVEEIHKTQLDELQNNVSAMYIVAIKNLKDLHDRQLQEIQEKCNNEMKEMEDQISQIKSNHDKFVSDLMMKHTTEIEDKNSEIFDWRLMFDKCSSQLKNLRINIEILKDEHNSSVVKIKEENINNLKEVRKAQALRVDELGIEWGRRLEMKDSECVMLRSRIEEMEGDLHKHVQIAIQGVTDQYKDLPAEVDSLKSVLHMKNEEIQQLRCDNMKLKSKIEDMDIRSDTVEKLHRRNQDLQALVHEKTQSEWNLSKEKVKLMNSVEKESKANKRLSMEREELLWKLYHDSLLDEEGGSKPSTPLRSRPPSLSFSPSDHPSGFGQAWFTNFEPHRSDDTRYHSLQRPTSRRRTRKPHLTIQRSKSLDSLKNV